MRLAEEISGFGSVAVVGLAKNTGKTTALNHILRDAHDTGLKIGVTSIGVDGETTDRVTHTTKPEIRLYPGTVFATGESYYAARRIQSEVTGVGERATALGRVVTARALSEGKVLLSGPPDTPALARLIEEMHAQGADTVLVDGALSRLSPANPAINEALVLATGAALSPDIRRIVEKTAFVCDLVRLPQADVPRIGDLTEREEICEITEEGETVTLGLRSALELDRLRERVTGKHPRLFIPGMAGDKLLEFLSQRKETAAMELIVKDFTRVFASAPTVRAFLSRGGRISVVRRPALIAVTVNPVSPQGYVVNGEKLAEELEKKLGLPVINVKDEEI